ncbi:hypothetical protein Bca4012_095616 [Brassica carinata]
MMSFKVSSCVAEVNALESFVELQSSDTDVGAVWDAMSMAVSHHAAAFPDGLQDVNNCRRVTVVGFKTLFPRKEEDHGAGRGTETPRRDERSSEAHCRFSGSFGF